MLFTFIENIRRQPRDVRRSYAVFITAGITLVIVVMYFFAMYLGALGTRPWDSEGDTQGDSTPASDIFNASNVFFEGESGESQPGTKDNWAEQIKSMNEQFMEERLLEN